MDDLCRPPRRVAAFGRALVALGVASVAAAGIALASTPSADPLGAMVGYLQRAQNLDGGFGGAAGMPSDPGFTAWVAIALAAAGINPQDQARTGGTDAYSYLLAHADQLDVTTDFARVALTALAAGTSLHDFGGVDLVQRIVERQRPDGAFAHVAGGAAGVNDTIFAVIALSRAPDASVRPRLDAAADWLLSAQNPDGGWPAVVRGGPTDLDLTGAAIQALNAIGRRGTPQEARAFALLRRLQRPDGGFPSMAHDLDANTATTAWVVQAIWSAGGNPRDWRHPDGGTDPLDYLTSMQQPDGSIAWRRGNTANALWMTAYAAPAYAGHPLPPPTVPRAVRREEPPPTGDEPPPAAPPSGAGDGTGGDDPDGGGAALAGGGGRGAPLFSRPRPQSRGRTVGGVRRTRDGAASARRRSRATTDDQDRRPTTGGRQRGHRAVRSGRAPHAARPVPVAVSPPAAAERAAAEVQAGAAGRAPGGGRGSGGGPGGDPQVTGTVIGGPPAAAVAGPADAAAPGIRGARAGGEADGAITLGFTGVLLIAAGIGTQLERRRPIP